MVDTSFVTCVLLAPIFIGLAGCRPPAEQTTLAEKAPAEKVAEPVLADEAVPGPGRVHAAEPIKISGSVRRADTNEVTIARVTVIAEGMVPGWYVNPVGVVVGSVETDPNGMFELEVQRRLLPAEQPRLTLYGSLGGAAIGWRHFDQLEGELKTDLVLQQEKPWPGRITDHDGKPVAGARVDLAGLFAASTETEPTVRRALLPDPLSPPLNSTITKDHGEFTVAGIGRGVGTALLRITHPDFSPMLKAVTLTNADNALIVLPASGVIAKGTATGTDAHNFARFHL